MMRLAWTALPLALGTLALAEEPLPTAFRSCFDASAMATAAPGRPPNRETVAAANQAFAAARSYRACVSFISLAGGASWGSFEYAGPDKRRWRLRHSSGRAGAVADDLEVVRIGGDTWFRGAGSWSRLADDGTLQEALPPGSWVPDPSEIVARLLTETSKLMVGAPTTARAGACEVWSVSPRPGGASISEALCVGRGDQRAYRVASGGPAVEAYLQLEIYDFDAPVEIAAPR